MSVTITPTPITGVPTPTPVPDPSLLEALKKANDVYHEACNAILQDKNLPVEIKANFGSTVRMVFDSMKRAESIIAKYYG